MREELNPKDNTILFHMFRYEEEDYPLLKGHPTGIEIND